MKKIVIERSSETIVCLDDISEHDPIFVMKGDTLVGMVVHEAGMGWITRLGGARGATGHHYTLKECIMAGQNFGYSYYIDVIINAI